jgi:hypothetical protein
MVNPLLAMREPYGEVVAASSSMCIGSASFVGLFDNLRLVGNVLHSLLNRAFFKVLELKDISAVQGA